MDAKIWNRMYDKLIRATRQCHYNRPYALVVKRRWLKVMERRTGKNCFLLKMD